MLLNHRAYLVPMDDTDLLWTTSQAAQYLGVATSAGVSTLRRMGLQPLARQPSRNGQLLWSAEQVRTTLRPGRGRQLKAGGS